MGNYHFFFLHRGRWCLLGRTEMGVTGGLAELMSASGAHWDRLGSLRSPHPVRSTAIPHRRLGICKAELHLQDVLRAQPQMATEKGHEDRVVTVILQGRRVLGGPALPFSPIPRASVPSHLLAPPGEQGLSYCSIERPWLSIPLLQLLLDCCGKDGDSVG